MSTKSGSREKVLPLESFNTGVTKTPQSNNMQNTSINNRYKPNQKTRLFPSVDPGLIVDCNN